jgi:excisionase family DNA binding protein
MPHRASPFVDRDVGERRGAAPDRETYTVEEAGALLGIGRSAAYQAVKSRELPSVKIGKRLLVPKRVLERLLEGANSR